VVREEGIAGTILLSDETRLSRISLCS
jgi:hypothetical protein